MSEATTPASPDSSQQVAADKQISAHEYPRDSTIHELFAEQARRTPDRVAIDFEGRELTYAELESRSNQLAHRLRKMNVASDVLVALCVERSLEMVVGMLGILKAGGAYVPVDPAYPSDRIQFMLEDSAASVVLTQSSILQDLPRNRAAALCLDDDWDEVAKESTESPDPTSKATDLAYVIYTSGSTGRPKGVEIPHRGVVNFLCSLRNEPGLNADDRLVAVTTLSFDIAGLEIYLPLIVGARVTLASRAVAGDGQQLANLLVASGATVMQATPATWRLLLEANWTGNSSFRIFCGGETLPRDLAERLIPLCGELWNLYGPTEATIWSTIHRVGSGAGPVSIGHPIANTEIQILDEELQPVPPDMPGELFIGGDGLARGYRERPDLTAERFITHPLEGRDGDKLYRTGDLAKVDGEGLLQHLGRVDFQVKVRGFRIELGEIEAALEQHPNVTQAVVAAREDVPGEKRLVGYVVSDGKEVSSRELRARLGDTLPDYMVPKTLVFLDSFPLTPNGKVDRKALPAPDTQRPEMAESYVEPKTQNEKLLAEIWAKILRLDRVGLKDNYFELGGDSLQVAQIATRIREAFRVNVPIRAMFEGPTVAELTAVVERLQESENPTEELPVRRVARDGHLPLSFAQERVWFIHQLNPTNLAYNFQSTFEFNGALDIDALERTLDEILRRHEAYRTTFPIVDGRPTQKIHPHERFTLPVIDLSGASPEDQEKAWTEWSEESFQRPFDLSKLPLVEWTLFKYGETKNVLVHKEHHTVHDGWAFNVFLTELVELYAAFSKGDSSPLPELEVQFADFAAWQHAWADSPVGKEQLDYWKKKLKNPPPLLELPTKGARPTKQSFKGAAPRAEIPVELCHELRALSRREGTTLFMTMLGAFVALLHRYTGETDIGVGTFFANRRPRESESLIGMILNNVVIRTALDNDPTMSELIARVRDVLLESANYQDVPFDRVVDAVQPKRDLSHNPLFQVMFSFHDEPMPEGGLPGLDVKLTPVISNRSAKFDLGVIGIPHSAQVLGLPPASDSDGLTMIWEHSTDLFELSTIHRLIAHYQDLLEAMVQNPSQRVSELALGSPEERELQTVTWNDTEAPYESAVGVHQRIAAQAERSPDKTAAAFGGETITYAELQKRSNQLARYLRSQGVEPGMLVGVCVERSLDMLVSVLGIWNAGGAYVPIDPAFPSDRRRFMIEDASLEVVITQDHLASELPASAGKLIHIDGHRAQIASESEDSLSPTPLSPDAIAYVIYTSGSTGIPKGVRVPHRSVVNFLTSMAREPGLTEADKMVAVTTLSFDISGLELFLPLTVGASLTIASRAVASNGEELAALLESSDATIMQATPTTWRMLIDIGWKPKNGFTALCGGEPLSRALAEELLEHVATLWNLYGPTETTIWSTVEPVTSGAGNVPIGRPIANTQVYVLDNHRNLAPIGVVGELYIGGDGVTLGYLDRPELTADRFVPDTFRPGDQKTLYRTGDLARYLPDGRLECLGRTDHQVKVRGFRIELGEIETALGRHPGVRECVVIVREDVPNDKRIVAYYTSGKDSAPTSNDLASALRQSLPDYMIPSAFVAMEAFPLTPNEKIDRGALPAPTGLRTPQAEFAPPRNQKEEELVTIWQDVLGASPVGINDDFFDIGGHSLLAVKLVAEVEAQMGTRLPLATLFQNRTIEKLSPYIGADGVGESESPFHAVRVTGTRPPFFAGGSHPRYTDLAYSLGRDQPFYRLDVYGQQSQRIEQGKTPHKTVEEMAEAFLEDILRVEPEGPYYLGGGCEGAYVAFEIALQLQKMGKDVECLVLWIPPPLRPAGGRALSRSVPARMMRQFRHLFSKGSLMKMDWRGMSVLMKHEYLEYQIFGALDSYTPKSKYDGRISLIRTEVSPAISYDINQEWRDLSTLGAELHVVPGNHDNWLDDHMKEFSDVVSSSLLGGGAAAAGGERS
jgi:amino acid adenylation domain-containing protein